MAKTFVKAAGGCSAPALKDQEAAMARLGKLKFKQLPSEPGQPLHAQLLISHPNYSGLQMDQLTRNYTPAHFVSDIEIVYAGETLLTVEGAISLSEDPSIRFSYLPRSSGATPAEFSVRVRDTEDNLFTGTWLDQPATGS
jgi:sulfur-oxidizing protein SoxY